MRIVQQTVGLKKSSVVEYALWQKKGKGKTLVAIHCSGSSFKQWNKLADVVLSSNSDIGRVIAPNLHGSGASSAWGFPAVRPLTLDDSAWLIESALQNENIDQKELIILGHSHGGSVGTRLATRGGAERLILFEPNYLVLQPEPLNEVLDFLHSMVRTASADNFDLWGPLFYDFWFSQHPEDTWDHLDLDQRERLLATTIPHTYHEVNSLLVALESSTATTDLNALADHMKNPLLSAGGHIILSASPGRGSREPLTNLANLLQRRCAFSLSTLSIGGHIAPITHPEHFIDHVLPHLVLPASQSSSRR